MFITLMIFLLFLVPLETLKVPKMATEILCGVMWVLNSTGSFSNEQTRCLSSQAGCDSSDTCFYKFLKSIGGP